MNVADAIEIMAEIVRDSNEVKVVLVTCQPNSSLNLSIHCSPLAAKKITSNCIASVS